MRILCSIGRCKHNSKGWITRNQYGWCKLKQIKITLKGCENYNGLTDKEAEKKMRRREKK